VAISQTFTSQLVGVNIKMIKMVAYKNVLLVYTLALSAFNDLSSAIFRTAGTCI